MNGYGFDFGYDNDDNYYESQNPYYCPYGRECPYRRRFPGGGYYRYRPGFYPGYGQFRRDPLSRLLYRIF